MAEPCILLIEDNADDAFLASRIIGKLCAEKIVVVRDGEEASELLLKMVEDGSWQLIRLVFLDLKLPKMNGIGVLQTIRNNPKLQGLPVLVLTSSDNDVDQERCQQLGVIDYLFKPMTAERLQRALGKIKG
ncbi:response regulator [Geomonas sp.]|uniref:response regulator n=1 Tax=Geomonas sp. TaxID=2651584 RepID=UPI002B47663F|nr:response regulator [Geomonas sp.]HJV35747.1 response regulator [Geomonas sp.]